MHSLIARIALSVAVATPTLSSAATPTAPSSTTLRAVVEIEEEVYRFTPANNGAGPMWCGGSTCVVRDGERVFASGLETLSEAKPLNNVRWLLFEREGQRWNLLLADPTGRTREPSPLAILPGAHLLLSANPTLNSDPGAYAGPAEPQILQFDLAEMRAPFQLLRPAWSGKPRFTEHSYRSFAADGPNRELLLLQNIDYTHAEWTFRDRHGDWSANGQLKWPMDDRPERPQPIRICYPNVALQNRAAYFCGVSDIIEPNPAWRAYKRELTGREWDYDFRRLFFTWSPDLARENFRPWIEIASRESTCGGISPAISGSLPTTPFTSSGRNGHSTSACANVSSRRPARPTNSTTPSFATARSSSDVRSWKRARANRERFPPRRDFISRRRTAYSWFATLVAPGPTGIPSPRTAFSNSGREANRGAWASSPSSSRSISFSPPHPGPVQRHRNFSICSGTRSTARTPSATPASGSTLWGQISNIDIWSDGPKRNSPNLPPGHCRLASGDRPPHWLSMAPNAYRLFSVRR